MVITRLAGAPGLLILSHALRQPQLALSHAEQPWPAGSRPRARLPRQQRPERALPQNPSNPSSCRGPPGPPSTRHLPAQASARLRHPSSLPPHTCLPGPRSHPAQRHPEASVHGHPPAGEPGESELNLKCTGWRVTLGMGGAVENEGTGRLAHRCADRCIAATRQKLDRDYFLFFPMPAWAGITGCAK